MEKKVLHKIKNSHCKKKIKINLDDFKYKSMYIIVECNMKAPFSIAMLHFTLDPNLMILSVKKDGIKYHIQCGETELSSKEEM